MALTEIPIELSSTPGIVDNSNATAITIDSSENVGIGTSSPAVKLHVADGADSNAQIRINGSTSTVYSRLYSDNNGVLAIGTDGGNQAANSYMMFEVKGTERMRINASGNLLVGKTADDATTDGIQARGIGAISIARTSVAGDALLILNKKTNDGTIAEFRKDGTTVGSIGAVSGDIVVGTGNTGLRFYDAGRAIQPRHTDGTAANDVIDLGMSSNKFKDLYLSGTANANSFATAAGGTFTTASGNDLNLVYPSGRSLFIKEGSETHVTVDNVGNLLVGTTSASTATQGIKLRNDLDAVAALADGQPSGYFGRLNSDGDILNFNKAGTTVGSIGAYSGDIYIGEGDTALRFNADNDLILPFNGTSGSLATRDAAIDLGTTGGRFKDLYLSGGAYLGGTGAANKLEDYEEGTWTPAYTTTSSDATVAYTTQRGKYTKVGNLVFITWYVEFGTVTSAGTGNVKITGVPFQAESSNDSRGEDTFYNVNWDSANYNHPVSYLPSAAASAIQWLMTRDNGSWTVATTSTLGVTSNDIVSGSMTFRV